MRLGAFLALLACCLSCGKYLEKSLDSARIEGDAVVFSVKVPSARTVQIAADWPGNNWARGDAEEGEVLVGLMEQTGEPGVWQITVRLSSGRYRYRFLINEVEWLLDPENPRIVDDGRGGKANLLIVP
jgi:1,4-alpha-glucan branching enzyme